MIPQPVLVTGGAGFIGSHLVESLLAQGLTVRVLDNLDPQVHGPGATHPALLPPGVEFFHGSVTDRAMVDRVLNGVRSVVHLAAAVGVGQSMYAIAPYVETNSLGTATLLDVMVNGGHSVKRLVVASSMSIYGEGAYRCPRCGPCAPPLREAAQFEAKRWELVCPSCGGTVDPVPTPESKPLAPTSIYAITKRDQEEMCLCIGRAYGIPTTALRFFNVYGERQALSNPYTGVAAIFSACLLNDQPPLIYEDGRQSRDFIHVSDIVQAVLLVLDRPEADYRVFNVGTGLATTVAEVAVLLADSLGKRIPPRILQTFRAGDIRHCVGDVTQITTALGFRPRTPFQEGMTRLIGWIKGQRPQEGTRKADAILRDRGLVK